MINIREHIVRGERSVGIILTLIIFSQRFYLCEYHSCIS